MKTEYATLLDSETPEPTEASRGKRFLNYLIDLVITVLFYTAIVYILAYQGIVTEELDTLQSILLSWLITFVYYTLFESIFAKSPGKFITRTHVLNSLSERPNFTQILGRSLARLIPFDAFSFLGNGKWHDAASNTTVVND